MDHGVIRNVWQVASVMVTRLLYDFVAGTRSVPHATTRFAARPQSSRFHSRIARGVRSAISDEPEAVSAEYGTEHALVQGSSRERLCSASRGDDGS